MKRHRGRLIAVAAAAVPVLALTACAGSTTPASTQKPVSKVFTYDTTAPVMVDGWDPATEYSDGIIAMSEMYETLTHYNSATNTVGPMLATSWSSADGGKTWTFHLRHGVTFHTGRPMTAQAAKASILRTIKLNGGASYIWAAVKTIDTPDQYTLVFHLSYASPLALEASADYSAYIYDTQGPAGPSLWSSFKGDSSITTVSSPSWQNLLAQLNVKTLSLPVRQAVLYAIDYRGIIAALRGAGVQSSGIVPPGMFGHFSDLPDYSYDKAKAAALLNSAGYGPGKKKLNLSLTYTQGDSNE